MTAINRSALVPYTPAQMYELVNDIEAYPTFLPWCQDARVLSSDQDEIRACLNLAKGSIQKSFTTRNLLQKDKMIEMRLLEGPFKHLEGLWRFDPVGEAGCRVSLALEFEFSSKLMGFAMGPMFNQIASTLVDSFVQRAEQVYGKP